MHIGRLARFVGGCGLLVVWGQTQASFGKDAESARSRRPAVYSIPLTDDAQYQLLARLIEAIPGDVIQFEEGRYEFRRQIDIAASHLTLRGRGSDRTVLSFRGQRAGNYGIEASAAAMAVPTIQLIPAALITPVAPRERKSAVLPTPR